MDHQLSSIYDREFFLKHSAGSTAAARNILPPLVDRWRPVTSIDVGCGSGEWVAVLDSLGVRCTGIDGTHVPIDVRPALFLAVDLTNPTFGRELDAVDLVVCVEVAEHLPESSADSLVEQLTTLSSIVLFSAAIPGQGGRHHVNEQPHSYWVQRFAAAGLTANTTFRHQFLGIEQIPDWYRNNIIVFERTR